MELSELDRQQLIEDIINDFGGKLDGQRRNIIMDCPFCGKKEKFGIYVGPEKSSKHFGMANCFRCGRSFDSLEKTLTALEREEWIPKQVTELGGEDDELIAYIYGQRTTDPAVVLAEMQTTMVALQGDGSDVVEEQLKAMFDN